MNSLKVIFGIALTLSISGCGLARVYNKIELGEPLPADLGLVEWVPDEFNPLDSADPHDRVFDISECYVWHTPLTTSAQTVTVWTDVDARIAARSYENITATNLILLIIASINQTTDIIIPAEAIANPQDMQLGDIMPDISVTQRTDASKEAANRAMKWTLQNMVGYALLISEQEARHAAYAIPLSSVLTPGSHETVAISPFGCLTISNLGENQLRLETHISIVADPAGVLMYPIYFFKYWAEESKQDDEESEHPQRGIE
jgi:hypothetical protein